ncbi:MAG: NADH-quinone oxidoreductase subunit J, partial [Gammaproteobacteria bacterium]
MIETIIFYVFAAMTVASAIAVVTVRNPIHAALSLVLTFFTSAIIWMTLEAEFLAIILVLVYVGVVMVL